MDADDCRVEGMFDFSLSEEMEPIWITDRLVTLFGEMDTPDIQGVVSLRLLKHEMFGTGGHPATKRVLWTLLEDAADGAGVIPSPFLELGKSTGLLALVAATTGTAQVFHASQSITSSALAEDNAMLNGHEVTVEPTLLAFDLDERADFYACVATQRGGETATLEEVPHLYHTIKPGGLIIWGGHLAAEHQEIKSHLEQYFTPVKVDDLVGWPVLIMRKEPKE